jgi:PAS domain-containing protein
VDEVTAGIRDVTARKQAEAEVLQMEGRYRGLLEAAPDAMVVVDQDGEIVLLNVQAEKQFGYRRDELVGQMMKNIIPEGFAERLIADLGFGVLEISGNVAMRIDAGGGRALVLRARHGKSLDRSIGRTHEAACSGDLGLEIPAGNDAVAADQFCFGKIRTRNVE